MDIDGIVAELKSERERISQAIAVLDGARTVRRIGRPAGRKHRLSAEGRRRIIAAAKKRWAKFRAAGKKK